MTKEEYRQLYKELYPLVEQIQGILKAHGVNKGISLTTAEDGYVSLDLRNIGDYGLTRLSGAEDALLWDNNPMHLTVAEPLFEEGGTECGQETDRSRP